MRESVGGVRVLACLFLVAVGQQAGSPPMAHGLSGIPLAWAAHQPDLATASWRELACLPGVGPARARAIVAHRAGLGVPIQASLIGLIPGIGAQTAQAIQAALAPQAADGPG
jgi:DNA uptake protein ComE-like DNA-binding protein